MSAVAISAGPRSASVRSVPRAKATAPAMHLTRRGRVVMTLIGLALAAVPFVLTGGATAQGPAAAPQVERHVVLPGQTLWQIAAGIAEPGQDVRDVVLGLIDLNDLPGSGLAAGQTILVPVG